MGIHRRSFISGVGALVATGSMARVIGSTSKARARSGFTGYGELVPDPNGVLDLPAGFKYRIFSREGDALSRAGIVPSNHDGMAAFSAGPRGIWLVRNHEVEPSDVEEDAKLPVAAISGATYDPEGTGGTTTLLVSRDRRLVSHHISLAGTVNNCAGGATPWNTWLSCEETDEILSKPHGYVFEVDPRRGGNPEPIVPMGRLEHEAVAFDRHGTAYLTEDASGPLGCVYRFVPKEPLCGVGSLHAGGTLTALAISGVDGDLSVVQEPGTVLPIRWVPVPNSNPGAGETPVREQVQAAGATPIRKAEGVWRGFDGSIWLVSSYAEGPDAEEADSATLAVHAGQIWRIDPERNTIELVAFFPEGSPYDGPDNITAGPHGFAIACTDGEDDQWLVGIGNEGGTFPFALNVLNDVEFAGATFSPSGQTLFANIQEPGMTLAIWGRW
jgi:secreted PhoX family phosphatase